MTTPRIGAAQILVRRIEDLKPCSDNPRKHSARQIVQLAKSIEAFGFNNPLLIDNDNAVIAGEARRQAAMRLGWTEVPTISLNHLTEHQIRGYRIADNALSDNSSWDERLLAENLTILSNVDLDFDLNAIGFEMPEIEFRIRGAEDDVSETVKLPAADAVAVSTLGDLWQLGLHRILCGSALLAEDYDRLLDGKKVQAVFSDPPYNVRVDGHVSGNGAIHHREFAMASGEMSREAFTTFLTQSIGLMRAHSEPGALVYLAMDWRHIKEMIDAYEAVGLDSLNLCVWAKDNGGMGSLYRSQHELFFVLRHPGAPHRNNVQLGRFGRYRTNVWRYAGVNTFGRTTGEGNLLALHPTVKPVALIADAIRDSTDPGHAVLDPFLGSGSTLLAAERTGRVAFGIELDPLYVDVAIRRWQSATGQEATMVWDGRTFAAIAAERALTLLNTAEERRHG
ncbi:site-specific DNA-methyltransferase [Rhodanobacter sp. L36]|uniref:site-specific DNA-methyltransferase n=1 Tax=Rhodanobacter sp. L36 TaxID=1747221 RepID=UPI00131B15C0|nr:site-specific DNA-methyltransferase [Rhodanobacter sp. L36]